MLKVQLLRENIAIWLAKSFENNAIFLNKSMFTIACYTFFTIMSLIVYVVYSYPKNLHETNVDWFEIAIFCNKCKYLRVNGFWYILVVVYVEKHAVCPYLVKKEFTTHRVVDIDFVVSFLWHFWKGLKWQVGVYVCQ